MIRSKVGDILDSRMQTLTNTVNCVGIMGKGIALDFKKRFPEMFEEYVGRCRTGQVKLGEPYLYKGYGKPWILNFPTKDHWRSMTRLADIVTGLEYLAAHYREWGITSLAVPPLGCGNGQLDWRVVGPTLYRHLSELPIPVEMFAPRGTPPELLSEAFLAQENGPKRTKTSEVMPHYINPTWVPLVAVVDQVTKERYHRPIGRIALQKMAYLLTAVGVPTGFEFVRGPFGPFSPDLKEALGRMINNGLLVEERDGQRFVVTPGSTYEDARKVYAGELEKWKKEISKLTDLMLRLTTHGAEITATVFYSARSLAESHGRTPTEQAVLEEVMKWKRRRLPTWDRKEVALVIRDLNALRFVNLEHSDELLPVPAE
ncbi:MAG: macro domain-containing protein [Thermoplasmata archaeon]|nr:macro domain-containing protein [Thermoplasmata archaeon]